TIVDDDAAPALVINDVEIVEGDSGTSNAVFTVSLSAVSGKTVTVDFTTKDGTAESTGAFIDFEAVKGSLQFLPGETVKTLVVPIIGDLVQEQIATGTGDATVISDEQFTVELSNAANATIVDGVGAGTIGNGADSQVGLFLQEARVVEGNSGTANAVFTAVLSGRATSPVTFTLSTQSGIAIAGLDFTAKTQQLTIPTGSTQATFTVAVAGDSAFEPTEVFFVNLTDTSSNVTVVGEAVGDAQATVRGYIFNDDIQVLDGGRTIQWIDVDGDLVTLKSNKVGLNLNQGDDFTFVNAGSLGGRQLQLLDLSNDGSAFAGANISITANPQPGFPSDLVTDGRVDVGYIHAAVFDSNEFQISGIDLGTISIDGDLARIDAGDQFSTPAIKKLEVYSIGVRGTSTGAGNTASKLLGPLSTLSVEQNVEGSIQVLGAEFGKIGTIKVGGALKGGAADLSGHITATGRIGTATFGSIIGGAGDASGYLGAAPNNPVASIGTVKVLGDVIGGEGTRSGAIYATKIAAVSFGSVIGGAGDAAGSVEAISKLGTVTLTDDLRGGTGFRSGEILASGIGVVKIGGDIIGGAGERSGLLISFGSITSASTGGAVIGGGGLLSGAISAINGNLGTIQLGMNESGDSLVGGSGGSSGRVQSLVNTEGLAGVGNITSLTTAGNIRGGTGENSGSVLAFANLSKLVIGKSLIGGNSSGPTTDGLPATALDRSGMIEAGRIKSMVINENIEAGRNGGAGLTNSGAIRAHAIDSLTVKGNLVGLEANPVVIAGSGLLGTLALKSINIGGNVEFAEILAGYNDAAAGTPSGRGKMVNADASIGAVIITGSVHGLNIVAGGQPGPDGRFGTTDDPLISGTGTQDVPKVISSIASVVIKGSILTNTDPYGIVAQNIGSVRVGTPGAAVTLIKGPGNDTTPREIAPGTDFYVRELFLPTA
ncbi:MAG: conserved repeat domain protein, partial [Chthoniobacter sp.]|nr:conserved repeat domain protein [Chthoniobacter sp.]